MAGEHPSRRDFLAGVVGVLAGAAVGGKVFSGEESPRPKNKELSLLGSVVANARKKATEKMGTEVEAEREIDLVFPETDVLFNEFEETVADLDERTAKAINKLKPSLFSTKRDLAATSELLRSKWQEISDHELEEQSKRNMGAHVGNIFLQKEIIVPLAERAAQEFGVPLWVIMGVIGVESGGDTYAYNPDSGAAGIMQITDGTAKSLGLKIDWETGVDERFDMEKNVMAAAKYLGRLYERFGQWSLALTAYSGGPTKLQDRIKKCYAKNNVKSEDFGYDKTELDTKPARGLKEKGVNIVTLYSKQFCGQGGNHSVQYPFWVEAMADLMKEKMGSGSS